MWRRLLFRLDDWGKEREGGKGGGWMGWRGDVVGIETYRRGFFDKIEVDPIYLSISDNDIPH